MRLIHAWYADPADLARAGRMGLIADVQPSLLLERFAAVERSLGPERSRWAHAYRTMIDRGVRVNLSSDFPGTVNGSRSRSTTRWRTCTWRSRGQDLHGQPAGGWLPSSASHRRGDPRVYHQPRVVLARGEREGQHHGGQARRPRGALARHPRDYG